MLLKYLLKKVVSQFFLEQEPEPATKKPEPVKKENSSATLAINIGEEDFFIAFFKCLFVVKFQ